MSEFTEVDFTVGSSIHTDPDGGDVDTQWQWLHGSTAQVREDHSGGGAVFEHVFTDGGEIGAAPAYDNDFIEFVILIEVVFFLDCIIKENKS